MTDWMIQLITAFAGSLGFALLFHLRRRLLFTASLGGLLSWGVYLLGTHMTNGIFLPCLCCAAFAALYGEIAARLLKAPATVIFIPAIVPSIPGSTLYYTMSCIVQKDWTLASQYGMLTLQYALAIAIGISAVWAAFYMAHQVRRLLVQNRTSR